MSGHDDRADLTHRGGKLQATLKTLLLEPGSLTEELLAGRRARWLSPPSVYVVCCAMYFLAGPVVARLTGEAGRPTTGITITDPDRLEGGAIELTPEARQLLEQAGAKQLLGEDRLNRMTSDIGAFAASTGGAVSATIPIAMFLLMPAFALLTWLAWSDSAKPYQAHLTFSLHLHSAWFAAMFIGALSPLTRSAAVEVAAALGVLTYSTWYAIVAFKRVLGGTSAQLFVRSTVVGLVYAVLMLVATLAAIAYATLTY